MSLAVAVVSNAAIHRCLLLAASSTVGRCCRSVHLLSTEEVIGIALPRAFHLCADTTHR